MEEITPEEGKVTGPYATARNRNKPRIKEDLKWSNSEYTDNDPIYPKIPSKIKGKTLPNSYPKQNAWFKWANLLASDMLGAREYAATDANIEKNRDILHKGYRRSPENPDYRYSRVYDGLPEVMKEEKSGAERIQLAKSMLGADGNANNAFISEVFKLNRQGMENAQATSSQKTQTSIDKAIDTRNYTHTSEIETANRNIKDADAKRQVNAQIDAEANLQKQTNENKAITEARSRLKSTIDDYQQFHLSNIQNQAKYMFESELEPIQTAYNEWLSEYKKSNPNYWQTLSSTEEYKEYARKVRELQQKYQLYLDDGTGQLMGWPSYKYWFQYFPEATTYYR